MFGKSKMIESLKYKINKLENENSILMDKLEAMKCDLDNTPEDCTRGQWCRACEFNKCYHVCPDYIIPGVTRGMELIYVCGKGNACKNFVEKRKENC